MKKLSIFFKDFRIVSFLGFVFFLSYFVFSAYITPKNTTQFSVANSEEYEVLSQVFGLSAEASHQAVTYVSTRVYGDFQTYLFRSLDTGYSGPFTGAFWCDSGATRTYYSNQTGTSTNSAVWYGCYVPSASLPGKQASTPLVQTGPSSYSCADGGSEARSYGYDISGDFATVWYACFTSSPVTTVVTPSLPVITQASCDAAGNITTSFSSDNATLYAVRLRNLSDSTNDTSCDPAGTPNDTCQWQTGKSLNRSGIAGHTYRFWVHGATTNTWAAGTYSNEKYAADFTCPAAVTYSCTGSIPANATMYSNDNVGLSSNTSYTYSATDTGTRCQYSCNFGYNWNGSACALPSSGGGAPAPTLNFTATPGNLPAGGGTTTLTWSTTNAARCNAPLFNGNGTTNGWSGSKPTSSTGDPRIISGTTTFTLECFNSDETQSIIKSAIVTVASAGGGGGGGGGVPVGYCAPPSTATPPWPDCSTFTHPTGLDPRNYAVVNHGAKYMTFCQESVVNPGTWVNNVSQCYGTGCWSGSSPKDSSGAYEVSTSYVSGTSQTYRCNTNTGITEKNTGSGWSNVTWGSTSQNMRCLAVNTCATASAPIVNLTATPLNLPFGGGTTTLTWTSTNATSCVSSGAWGSSTRPTTTPSPAPFVNLTTSGNYTFTLTCTNSSSGLSGSDTKTVTVASGGASPSAAETTVTVNNVCAPDCTNAPNICSDKTFGDGCSGTCSGTRSCDYNWKEVAP